MRGHVQVYRNLHRTLDDGTPVYSIRNSKGIVEGYSSALVLTRCVFRVSERGKQRVRKEKRKNVHAYIQGKKTRLPVFIPEVFYGLESKNSWVDVTYNPYKNDTFIRKDTGEAVHKAEVVIFNGKKVQAINVNSDTHLF